jgi:hypothetical protein
MTSAMPSRHAGDRSFQRDVNWEHVKLAMTSGRVTQGDNGNYIHEVRHPDNPEHVIKVVTSPDRKKIVSVMIKQNQGNPALSMQQAKEKANAERVRQQTTAQRQAERLAKKHKRNPPKS